METKIVKYSFDIREEGEKLKWGALKKYLRDTGHERFKAIGNRSGLIAGDIELEETHIFGNQWNSDQGRVFDWYQDYIPKNSYRKMGHYLEMTQEMVDIRNTTHSCGFCGHQERPIKNKWCPKCLGSEFLEKDNLPLTLMLPVSSVRHTKRIKEEQEKSLATRWGIAVQMKVHTMAEKTKKEAVKKRNDVIEAHVRATADAEVERNGFIWLLDAGINTSNIIYYPRSREFCVGWRSEGLTVEEVKEWKKVLKDFPFPVEYKELKK